MTICLISETNMTTTAGLESIFWYSESWYYIMSLPSNLFDSDPVCYQEMKSETASVNALNRI